MPIPPPSTLAEFATMGDGDARTHGDGGFLRIYDLVSPAWNLIDTVQLPGGSFESAIPLSGTLPLRYFSAHFDRSMFY